MLELIWLPLLACKSFLAHVVNNTMLAMVITFILFFDYVIIVLKSGELEAIDLFFLILLGLSVVFRNFVSVFDILVSVHLLKRVPINRILFIKFFFELFCIIVLFICLSLGIFTDELKQYDKSTRLLHSFGLGNSNVAALFFFQFLITLLLLWKRFDSYIFLLISLVIDFLVYKYCYGRTYHYGYLIMVIFMIFSENKTFDFLMRKFCRYIGFLCTILTFILPILAFTNSAFSSLQQSFTGRLFYFYDIINNISAKNIIFGLKYTDSAPLDSSYLYIFLNGGMFFVLFFLRKFRKSFDSEEYIEHADLPFIIGYSIAGFTESFFAGVSLSSILFWLMLINKKSNKTNVLN